MYECMYIIQAENENSDLIHVELVTARALSSVSTDFCCCCCCFYRRRSLELTVKSLDGMKDLIF